MIEPIRKSLVVPADAQAAFLRFTRDIASWWPTAEHSVFGDDVQTVVFEAHAPGRLYERHRDGREQDWGDVLVYEPYERVCFTFMKYAEGAPTEVDVRFTRVEGGTRVDLEHRGWEAHAEDRRHGYEGGWDVVLAPYTDGHWSTDQI
ncbi:MAG: SRPBCC domain-containing protein [Myxococcales bacterium]|nr:SRPBCC domain-containing protein [Myxococcales bacterium]